ncbi:MAG: AAA-associated domain-containing protein [Nitrososphaeraceae archaeon]
MDYYRQASETLGLIKKQTGKYELTDIAQRYLRLPTEKKAAFICKLLLEFPIMNKIFIDISSDHNKVITKQDIIKLLKEKSSLTGSTLERRARTIRSWFRWIRNNLGIVEVDKYGNIKVSRQMKLD